MHINLSVTLYIEMKQRCVSVTRLLNKQIK